MAIATNRMLLVSDWAVDPHTVVAEASRRAEAFRTEFGLVVPAWLHGLDWAGDPFASVPCAHVQLDTIRALASAAALPIAAATVGDPDPATAIYDSVEDWPPDEILVFAPAHRIALWPFDLEHRARRLTGLPVERIASFASRTRHCVANVAAAA
jgi:hypothetical protein